MAYYCHGCNDQVEVIEENGFRTLLCKKCGNYQISDQIFALKETSPIDYSHYMNMVNYYLARSKQSDGKRVFYVKDNQLIVHHLHTDFKRNLSELYPKSEEELILFILENLVIKYQMNRQPAYYKSITNADLFLENHRDDFSNRLKENILGYLLEKEYLKCSDSIKGMYEFSLLFVTQFGFIHLNEKSKQFLRRGFIAIKYSQETESIREKIVEGITSAGCEPNIIGEKHFNGNIMIEMLNDIYHSSFLVMDATFPNYGAYYEAGYAKAAGVQVIFTCKKEVFTQTENYYIRPHFDVLQENFILWDDLEDLRMLLKRRIDATITKTR